MNNFGYEYVGLYGRILFERASIRKSDEPEMLPEFFPIIILYVF